MHGFLWRTNWEFSNNLKLNLFQLSHILQACDSFHSQIVYAKSSRSQDNFSQNLPVTGKKIGLTKFYSKINDVTGKTESSEVKIYQLSVRLSFDTKKLSE